MVPFSVLKFIAEKSHKDFLLAKKQKLTRTRSVLGWEVATAASPPLTTFHLVTFFCSYNSTGKKGPFFTLTTVVKWGQSSLYNSLNNFGLSRGHKSRTPCTNFPPIRAQPLCTLPQNWEGGKNPIHGKPQSSADALRPGNTSIYLFVYFQ